MIKFVSFDQPANTEQRAIGLETDAVESKTVFLIVTNDSISEVRAGIVEIPDTFVADVLDERWFVDKFENEFAIIVCQSGNPEPLCLDHDDTGPSGVFDPKVLKRCILERLVVHQVHGAAIVPTYCLSIHRPRRAIVVNAVSATLFVVPVLKSQRGYL
jgi:hypothetical protein